MSEIAAWQGFCQSLGLQVVAIIYSDYQGVSDVISSEKPLLRGNVHRLQRGEDVSSRPMVQALARVLLGLI